MEFRPFDWSIFGILDDPAFKEWLFDILICSHLLLYLVEWLKKKTEKKNLIPYHRRLWWRTRGGADGCSDTARTNPPPPTSLTWIGSAFLSSNGGECHWTLWFPPRLLALDQATLDPRAYATTVIPSRFLFTLTRLLCCFVGVVPINSVSLFSVNYRLVFPIFLHNAWHSQVNIVPVRSVRTPRATHVPSVCVNAFLLSWLRWTAVWNRTWETHFSFYRIEFCWYWNSCIEILIMTATVVFFLSFDAVKELITCNESNERFCRCSSEPQWSLLSIRDLPYHTACWLLGWCRCS